MSVSSSRRIAKNSVFLYIRMLVIMLINIFSVRYVLKGLGVVDYGVFNVVAGLVTMFASLRSIVSSATLRFHAYAIGEGNESKVSDVFTASCNIYALLALIILIGGEAVGLWFINTQADIPLDRVSAANWVYQLTIFSFVIGLMTVPFSSLIFAYERMGVFSIISVGECLLKFILAYFLIYIPSDHLVFYGLGLLIIQSIHFLAYYVTARNGCGSFHYRRKVEKTLYKQLISFSGWTLFSSSASVGISQLVTMITNVFFGPVVNAARAIAFQMNSAMNSFTGNIIMAIRPPMIKQYAEGDYEKVKRYFNFSNKTIFYSFLLIILPIYLEMETVLRVWLDVSDKQTVLFCRLILIYAIVLSLNNPIAIIVQATGNIRAYSTYVEIPTLLCFPITWLLYAIGQPAEAAFYVMIGAIMTSHVIRLICLKRLFSLFSYKEYVVDFILPALGVLSVMFFVEYAIHMCIHVVLCRLIAMFVAGSITMIILCSIGGFSKFEREALISLLKLNRFFPRG